MDGYVNKSQFAKIYGCSKPYVSQLVTAKRLVLSEDGKMVGVEASLKLLDVTSDPSKAGVRERWQAFREGREFEGVASDVAPAPAAPVAAPPAAGAGEQMRIDDSAAASKPAGEPLPLNRYRDARTVREEAEAQMAQIELRKAQGKVLEAEPTLKAVLDAHVAARMEIMLMRDRLAQQVAPVTDPRKVYDLITAECERTCANLQRRAQLLARVEAVAA